RFRSPERIYPLSMAFIKAVKKLINQLRPLNGVKSKRLLKNGLQRTCHFGFFTPFLLRYSMFTAYQFVGQVSILAFTDLYIFYRSLAPYVPQLL
ncbi:MAG: hypothetical protein AABY45_08605, partial [Deltaproteobacteria bacterium]